MGGKYGAYQNMGSNQSMGGKVFITDEIIYRRFSIIVGHVPGLPPQVYA